MLVSAAGALADPTYPDIPGLDTFAGTVMHSARWDHRHDLTGERVAVIGTGASAIQVVPAIQPIVESVTVYQRTPAVGRAPHRPPGEAAAAPALPLRPGPAEGDPRGAVPVPRVPRHRHGQAARASSGRSASWPSAHLHRQVRDPKLRTALTPDYTIGCKRILISNDYFPAVAAPNAELVTAGIAEVRPHSIVTTDGVERPTDTIVLATGFHVTDLPIAEKIARPRRAHPRRRLVRAAWSPTAAPPWPASRTCSCWSARTSGVGHTSMVYMIESQVAYVDDALRTDGRRRASRSWRPPPRRRPPTAI